MYITPAWQYTTPANRCMVLPSQTRACARGAANERMTAAAPAPSAPGQGGREARPRRPPPPGGASQEPGPPRSAQVYRDIQYATWLDCICICQNSHLSNKIYHEALKDKEHKLDYMFVRFSRKAPLLPAAAMDWLLGGAAGGLFDYNRENFMFDKERNSFPRTVR